jgi:hypothetical protein
MTYRYDRRASQGIVVRVDGGFAPTCDAFYDQKRSGHFYRGMEEAEWRFIHAHGFIKSNNTSCVRGEGTCFSRELADAESYVDFGHTDPVKTGRPNYVIEVKSDILKHDPRDDYYKTMGDEITVPKSEITRAWRLAPEGTSVVAYPEHV